MSESDSEKGGPRRRRIQANAKEAFIAAVRGGARLEDAACAAGFTIHGFYGARRRDSDFAAAWAEALAWSAAEERMPGPRPIAPNNGRRLQVRRMRNLRFDEKRRDVFLSRFAGTCDTTAAAEAAGVDESTVYKHRRRDPAFAAAFDEALEQGYVRLEAEALRQRIEAQRRIREDTLPTGEIAAEFERVMKLLARWERKSGRAGPRTVAPAHRQSWTFDEAIDVLAKRLRALNIPVKRLPPAAGEGAA